MGRTITRSGRAPGSREIRLNIVAERIEDGQDLRREIERITKENDIQAGSILCGIGGLKTCRIRIPVMEPGQPRYIDPGVVEISALQGTLSPHSLHCHIAVCDEEGRMWGGHLSFGCIVRMTCELVIAVHDTLTFDRNHDPMTGYDELIVDRQSRARPQAVYGSAADPAWTECPE